MKTIPVDIILPTFNRMSWLAQAVLSVQKQTHQNWTLWVVDDGSTDGTAELLQKLQKEDPRVQFLRQPNQGVSAARNRGLAASKAPWVALLDSDDQWEPGKLELQLAYMAAHPEVPLVHTEEVWIRNGVRVNPMKKHKKRGGQIFADCLPLCCISPSSVLFKRSLLEEVGTFKPQFEVCEDYDLWLRICSRYEVGFIETPLVKKFGGHPDQLSRGRHSMDRYRIQALWDLLKHSPLTIQQREQALGMLQKKAKVLQKGRRKHQNLADYDRVFQQCRP